MGWLAPCPLPSDPPLRQSVALVWRTLRSMRTALILLLMIALASVAGSLLPQWPNTPGARAAVPGRAPVLGHVLRPRGALRRLRVVVVRAAHGAAVRLAGRVPRAAHAGALARRCAPRRCRPARSTRSRATPRCRSARRPTQAIDAARRTLRRRRFRVARDPARPALAAEKGIAREVGSLAFHWAFILLLVGRDLRQGHRVQRARRRRRGSDVGRRRGELRRHDQGRPLLRRLHRASACTCATSGATSCRPVSRWTSSPTWTCCVPTDPLRPPGAIRVNQPARVEGLWIYQSGLRMGAGDRGDRRRGGRSRRGRC